MNTSCASLKTTFEWKDIPWRKLERKTFKLQKRIFQASSRGDKRAVHKLQKMLMKSWSAKCLAVRRVTQENAGKKTAGIDGLKSLSPKVRLILVNSLNLSGLAAPTRRVYIPKPGTEEKRPLSIPTIFDRAKQALVKLALEPEWEALFEANSYGFRPGRSCHDAIQAIFSSINRQPKYVLDADILKCFDRINHLTLLNKLRTTPTLRRVIKAWLKAGVLEQRKGFIPTREGTPQGGVISPLLANIALHGLEHRIKQLVGKKQQSQLTIIRYADDFIILHKDLSLIEKAKEVVTDWLKGIGLELKPNKTKISHTLIEYKGNVGFDFLGFNVRQYQVSKYKSGKSQKGYKTLIKPSTQKVRQHLSQIKDVICSHKVAPQEALIGKLNPIIRGWCNYYSTVVSKEIFSTASCLTFQKLRAWSQRRHPTKSAHWVSKKYWLVGEGEGWIFAAKKGDVAMKLIKHDETPIKRHIKVQDTRSPYDGDWSYWATRTGTHPELPNRVAKLLKQQNGKCQHCGLFFTSESLMEIHHKDGNHKNNNRENLALLHRHCHDQTHGLPQYDFGNQELDEEYLSCKPILTA